MKYYDVVIMGAGLAGSCLARQLKLEAPKLTVLCLDKSKKIDNWKVGEATVEIAADYFGIKLGLQNYFLNHQLLKNGLRFLYDNEEKSLKLSEMSENGTTAFPVHCSYTFDRISLETDLINMNRDQHVEVQLGAHVHEIQLNSGEENHNVQFKVAGEDESKQVQCRWLIDSTGRRQLLLKKANKNITREDRLKTSSTWGRFKGLKNVDTLEDTKEWRLRANNTPRRSSVLHYMGVGYWIWIIQMPNNIFSIGVVYDNDLITDKPKTQKEFREFLNSHSSLAHIMEDCEPIDHMHFKNLAYYGEQFFSSDRWGLTGESAAFPDPFYSPGSDFIALANEFLTTLITDDFYGKKEKLSKKVNLYNTYYKDRYERVLRLYTNNYKYFGSHELMKKKYFMDLHNYYNIYYWPFLKNKHRKTSWVSRSNRRSEVAQKVLDVQMRMLDAYNDYLKKTGRYFSQNKGQWHDITAQSDRYNGLVKNDFSEQLSLKYLEETLAITALTIMSEIHNQPTLGQLPKYVVNEMNLQILLEWDVKNPNLLKPLYDLAMNSLQMDLNRKFQEANITNLRPTHTEQPLDDIQVEASGEWLPKTHLLSIVANESWKSLFHSKGNIYC